MPVPKPKLGFAVAAFLAATVPGASGTIAKLSGSIAGIVRDSSGVPQMGATVLLFNKYEKLIERGLTNERGAFGFDPLTPDLYSIRVSLSNFSPAMRQKIAVQPGMQSLLYINLAGMLSSVELVYAAPGQGALMSDDWKWTLKTATSTRPVLRFDPGVIAVSGPSESQNSAASIFSDTRGVLNVSAGDASSLAAGGGMQDLGTAFALATSLYGRNQLKVSGNVGYSAHTGIPAAGFRTTYSRDGQSPEVSVTMRQLYLPTRAGMAVAAGQQDGLPALRTMSLDSMDHLALGDDIQLEYGLSLDSVAFFDHLNYLSPFARLTYDLGALGSLQLAYSSGAPPTELETRSGLEGAELRGDPALKQSLTALALLPRVSLLDGRAAVQRTQNFEMGYEKVVGSRTVNVSAFRELVSNGAMTMMSPDGLFAAGDVLPDLASSSSIVNIGSYQRFGYAASVTQTVNDKLEVGVSAGRAGVLSAPDGQIDTATMDEVRSKIHTDQRYWLSARASATLPGSGTQIAGSYEWTDYAALMPEHFYVTQKAYPEPGLNIHIRQPIPFGAFGGRLEATADLRNVMAQGYLPLQAGTRRLLLMQNPRALRGGLSFIF